MPGEAANALFSLMVPAAFFLLLIRLDHDSLFRLLTLILALGGVSAAFGIIQAAGGDAFYTYRITNPEFSVGLFANRNHQAFLLAMLLPMLGVFAAWPARTVEHARFRSMLAMICALPLVPLIIITGSRMGLVVGVLGILAAVLIYQRVSGRKAGDRNLPAKERRKLMVAGFLAVILLGIVTVVAAQTTTFDRLGSEDGALDNIRFQVWRPILASTWDHFPIGSGIGSFVEVYKVYEPDALLSEKYLNHAHNDWLEVVMVAGLPGLFLLSMLVVVVGTNAIELIRRNDRGKGALLGYLAIALISFLALTSVFDYPLRTPILSCLFAFALVCLRRQKPLARG
ncbi:hypothetical protein GCM10022213_17950 [Parerythrobacter jejuensis]